MLLPFNSTPEDSGLKETEDSVNNKPQRRMHAPKANDVGNPAAQNPVPQSLLPPDSRRDSE